MDARCWRGCGQQGTFLHLWWTCPVIKPFWEAIAPWIEKLTPRPMEFTPLYFLFHGMPRPMKTYKKSIIPHLLNAAKLLVPRFWKQALFPTLLDWKKEVNFIMEAERWVYVAKGQQGKFEKISTGWVQCTSEIG